MSISLVYAAPTVSGVTATVGHALQALVLTSGEQRTSNIGRKMACSVTGSAADAAPTLIGTYSYVNPAIAAFLGWQFLHEELSGLQLLGMVIIIVGVVVLTLPGGGTIDLKSLEEPRTQ